MKELLKRIGIELGHHAPFTLVGALTGGALMGIMILAGVSRTASASLFWIAHPGHVFLSALVTAAMYRRHGGRRLLAVLAIGYVGSIGIATLSDSLVPYLGEWLLRMPYREVHIGFVEKWWLVNPIAVAGALVGYVHPTTKLPHAGHVLLSTWASLFHMTMAMGVITVADAVFAVTFLFVAVWLPCCTSDIIFPLLFTGKGGPRHDRSEPAHRTHRPPASVAVRTTRSTS